MTGRVLVVATALAQAFAALVEGNRVTAESRVEGGRGLVERLPALIDGVRGADFDLIAVLVGPGSFTGIRAGLAIAHGLALGTGRPLVGVTVGEAVRAGLAWDGPLWTVTDSHRNGVFLEGDGEPRSTSLDAIGAPAVLPLLAGDGCAALAAHLRSLGAAVRVTDEPLPTPAGIARAARARSAGMLAPLAAMPLYIDAPEISRAATDVRPPPA